MFQVTQLDLLRVGFAGAVHEYEGHLAAARRLSTRLLQVHVGELVLIAGALGFSVTAVLRLDVKYVIASAVFAGLALATFSVAIALNLPSRIYAHRWCASRLWLIRERYMELLSQVHDGALTPEGIHVRHDQLVKEIHAVVEHAPILDQASYAEARHAARSEKRLTDAEIDAILPASLHKPAPGASAASA